MNADYLDLLLAREDRSTPLAEPRIAPGMASASPNVVWNEYAEERIAAVPPIVTAPQSAPAVQPATGEKLVPQTPSALPPRYKETIAQSPNRETRVDPPAERSVPSPEKTPSSPPLGPAAHRELEQPASFTGGPPRKAEPAIPLAVETERFFPTLSMERQNPIPIAATRQADPLPQTTQAQAAPQPVTIRIDRIEVRAGATPAAPVSPKPKPGPRLGLDEYLKRRSGGAK